MARTYGSCGGRLGSRSASATGMRPRRIKAAVWGLIVAGAVAGVLVFVVAGLGRRGGSSARPVALLGDLEAGYPKALDDLMNHINIADKKSWMTEIYQKAKGAKLLHPLADIDPFTGQALDGNNYEALLRSHATKAIADQMDDAAKADMASAQQTARDAVGADAGCTHAELDQQDYAGSQATAVTGQECMDWDAAFAENLTTYDSASYPSLAGAQCRNPAGSKLGAWCILAAATNSSVDVEGDLWEYCDVGARCGVDMPVLRPRNSLHTQQLRDVGTEAAHNVRRGGGNAMSESRARQSFAAQAKQGMLPRFTGKEARKELSTASWLPRLSQYSEKPSGQSYISSKEAMKQLEAMGIA